MLFGLIQLFIILEIWVFCYKFWKAVVSKIKADDATAGQLIAADTTLEWAVGMILNWAYWKGICFRDRFRIGIDIAWSWTINPRTVLALAQWLGWRSIFWTNLGGLIFYTVIWNDFDLVLEPMYSILLK